MTSYKLFWYFCFHLVWHSIVGQSEMSALITILYFFIFEPHITPFLHLFLSPTPVSHDNTTIIMDYKKK